MGNFSVYIHTIPTSCRVSQVYVHSALRGLRSNLLLCGVVVLSPHILPSPPPHPPAPDIFARSFTIAPASHRPSELPSEKKKQQQQQRFLVVHNFSSRMVTTTTTSFFYSASGSILFLLPRPLPHPSTAVQSSSSTTRSRTNVLSPLL